jgi:hypothetical protein
MRRFRRMAEALFYGIDRKNASSFQGRSHQKANEVNASFC